MPRRPRRLSFVPAPQHAPSTPTHLSKPPSPSLPLTPLTPPLRLHLRTLIPSPPLTPQFLTTAPKVPHPWIWRCHVCHRVYKLSVTRRCLDDGHFFCSVASPPPSPVDGGDGGRWKGRRGEMRGCRAEFDYEGWGRYNIWRREVKAVKVERRGFKSAARNMKEENARGRWNTEEHRLGLGKDADLDFLGPKWKGRDCWVDCNFPSECHNYRAQVLREKLKEATRGREIEWVRERERQKERKKEMQRRVEEKLMSDVYADDIGMGQDMHSHPHKQTPTEGNTRAGGSSYDCDESGIGNEDIKSLYHGLVVGDTESGETDIQIQDCDGLGEEEYRLEYTRSKRRKSIEAVILSGCGNGSVVGDMEPSSPLKEEWDWGCEERGIWAKGKGKECKDEKAIADAKGGEKKNGDMDSAEKSEFVDVSLEDDQEWVRALRARSSFIRKFDEGNEGDEEDNVQ